MSDIQNQDKKKKRKLSHIKGEYLKVIPLEERQAEFKKIETKHPGKIPIIVERYDRLVPEPDSYRFLTDGSLSLSQFMIILRNRIKLHKEQALYLMIGDVLCTGSQPISQIYKEYKTDCGFLILTLCAENAFGRSISLKRDRSSPDLSSDYQWIYS